MSIDTKELRKSLSFDLDVLLKGDDEEQTIAFNKIHKDAGEVLVELDALRAENGLLTDTVIRIGGVGELPMAGEATKYETDMMSLRSENSRLKAWEKRAVVSMDAASHAAEVSCCDQIPAKIERLKAMVEAATRVVAEYESVLVGIHLTVEESEGLRDARRDFAALAQPCKTFPDTSDYIRALTQEIAALRLHIENRDNGLDVLALDALEHANEIRDAAVKPGAGQEA
jgi:hypothetical protein